MFRWLPLVLGACRFGVCEQVPVERFASLPDTLSATGLFDDIEAGTLAAGVLAYEPRFALWSDGAEKERWIRLPEGTAIDASDPDRWVFPVGTRAWKSFSRDENAIETRMIERTDDGWIAVAYVWNADGTDATATPEGTDDAHGTTHDVPSAEQCVACHGGRQSYVLGFSAVQLDGTVLDALVADGRLVGGAHEAVLPGDSLDTEALGYLHANCSHCHNAERDETVDQGDCYEPGVPFDFTIPASPPDTVGAMPALQTAEEVILPGQPDHSTLLMRASKRNRSLFAPSMPPLGTEVVDTDAVTLLTEWVTGL